VIGNGEKRFGGTQEKVAARDEAIEEMFDDATLGGRIEIDEDVGTIDDVEALHEEKLALVGKIHAGEADQGANLGGDLKFVGVRREVFLDKVGLGVTEGVGIVEPLFGADEGTVVQIRGDDFPSEVFVLAGPLFESNHAERVRLFTGGTGGAPDADFSRELRAAGLGDAREYDFAKRGELGRAAKKTGLADGDLVEELANFFLTPGADGEELEIIAEIRRLAGLHAAKAPVAQEGELVIRVENTADLIDEVSNADEIGIRGRGVARRG